MPRYLALGISETTGLDQFLITARSLDDNRIVEIKIFEKDFFSIDHRTAYWDLFAITDAVLKFNPSFGMNKVISTPRLMNREPLEAVRHWFQTNLSTASIITSSNSRDWKRHGMIRIDRITEIKNEYDQNKQRYVSRISFTSGNVQVNSLLNKDYGWLRYWNNIESDEEMQEKISYWIDFLNNPQQQRTLYAIISRPFKYNSQTGKKEYYRVPFITGFHLL